MTENKANGDCQTVDDLKWTGARICPFLGELCTGNQSLENCLLADSIQHGQAIRTLVVWDETDEPYAY